MDNDRERRAQELVRILLEAASVCKGQELNLPDIVVKAIEQLSASSADRTKQDILEESLPLVHPHNRSMNDWEKARLEYFQKHALPLLTEQLKFRGLGLQIFLASEAVLFNAWAQHKHWLIAIIGLGACLSLFLWDLRTQQIMGTIHEWGQVIADQYFFPLANGRPKDGVHVVFGKPPGKRWWSINWRRTRSHTVALGFMIFLS
jgi:hypothetical protein